MGAWGVVVDVLGSVAVGLLLMVLGWAAIERGRIHRQLTRRAGASRRLLIRLVRSVAAAAPPPGGERGRRMRVTR